MSNQSNATNTRYLHIRNARGSGTIAWRYNDDNKVIEAAVSKCSTKDQFNKKIGRMVSTGRLNKGQYVVLPYSMIPDTKFKTVAEFFHSNMEYIDIHPTTGIQDVTSYLTGYNDFDRLCRE